MSSTSRARVHTVGVYACNVCSLVHIAAAAAAASLLIYASLSLLLTLLIPLHIYVLVLLWHGGETPNALLCQKTLHTRGMAAQQVFGFRSRQLYYRLLDKYLHWLLRLARHCHIATSLICCTHAAATVADSLSLSRAKYHTTEADN